MGMLGGYTERGQGQAGSAAAYRASEAGPWCRSEGVLLADGGTGSARLHLHHRLLGQMRPTGLGWIWLGAYMWECADGRDPSKQKILSYLALTSRSCIPLKQNAAQ